MPVTLERIRDGDKPSQSPIELLQGRLLHDFQHRDECGGAGNTRVGMQRVGGKAWHGMGSEGDKFCLYADGGRVSGQDHEWLEDTLTMTVTMC